MNLYASADGLVVFLFVESGDRFAAGRLSIEEKRLYLLSRASKDGNLASGLASGHFKPSM